MIQRRPRHEGFTLIEMIVVIVIIGILAAILLPAVSKARSKAREAVAAADIRNIEMALRQYEQDNGGFPPDSGSWTYYKKISSTPTAVPKTFDSDEALAFFLTTTFRKNPTDNSDEVYHWADHGPYMELKSKQKGTGSHGLAVYKDPFGQGKRYVYDNNTDGSTLFTGGPHNSASFDLYCFGVNGTNENGGGDDIHNW